MTLMAVDGPARPAAAPGGSLHGRFARQAAARPAATALIADGRAVGYAELDRRAGLVARGLRVRGLEPGRVVGVCLERGADLVVAVLGVLKAGGAYTMLDPDFPARRLAETARAAEAALVLTDGATLLPGAACVGVLALEAEGADAERAGVADDEISVGPADLACVMFTSGSTGRPKGIVTSHGAILSTLLGQEFVDFDPGQVWLQCSPMSWDAFALELFGPLLSGATCVLQPGGSPVPDVIAELVDRYAVSTLYASASLLNFLLDEHPAMFGGTLRQVMTGGEAASVTHIGRLLREFPGLRVVNGYSPAENTIFTCCHEIDGHDVALASIPVGRAIAAKSVYVLDDGLNPVGSGESGELYMAGSGLAYGYLGAPGASAERFVADPFGAPGTRMYRTGDLVRERADGALEFLGRADQQLKIRGFRVEPAEIQAVLTAHPEVSQAAVLAFGEGSDKQLAAYVVGRAEPAALRAHAAEHLPAHLVPARFITLDALPRTATGKLDRAALPAPQLERGPVGRAAADGDERLLCEVFADVLGLPEVGPDQDFFALGGHSLLAAKAVSRLWKSQGVRLSHRALFDAPTAAGLAPVLAAARAELNQDSATSGSAAGQAVIPRLTPGESAPLSPVQARLWIADRLDPDTAEYVIPVALRLTGPLRRGALEAALTAIVRRHEPLRSRIIEVDGEPVQVVDPAAPQTLAPLDVPGGEDGVADFVAAQAQQPIDLVTGPLLRAVLGRVGAEDHVLVLCLHHIVADDWSVALLSTELTHHYGAALGLPADELPVLAPLPVSFADVSAWQRDRAAGLESEAAYWRTQLAGMPTTVELPADRPRPARRDVRGDSREFTVPAELAERLTAYGLEHGASRYMVLLAAFQTLVARYTGLADFAVGTPVAGREHPDTEALIGFFVNTLVLRADLSGEPDFAELLGRVRESVLEALRHQELPFDRVVEETAPDRDASRNPLVQLVFALQTAGTQSWALPSLEVDRLPAHTRTSKFDLFVALNEQPDGSLSGSIEYPVALFDAATIDRLAAHFSTLLEHAVGAPDVPVGRLPMLPAGEKQWLDRVLGDHEQPELGTLTVPQLVAEQVRLRPDAVAVEDARVRLTYRELDQASAGLARRLRGLGVGPDTAVALCLERGADAAVALLGILRAGGYYVPLDADYPADRIAFMLEDTRARIVLAGRDLAAKLSLGADVSLLIWEELATEQGTDVNAEVDADADVRPDDLAYVMYTSGSTGRPKGVQVTHAGIVRLVHGGEYADFDPGQVFLLLAPLSFDASTFELWGALCNGARLAVYPSGLPTADGLHEAIERYGVTVMWLTAGLFHSVLEARPDALDGLGTLIAGGDVLSPAHVRALVGRGVRVSDGYGPTEATTFTCVNRDIRPGSDGQSIPIGRPIANTRVHILDPYLAQVPPGVPGELMIAGPGLARGYRNRPGLTAERFVANPFAPGERMYRTGDVVRVLASGEIEFVGRNDHQVKIRGFRIEPGEVEARLRAHPGVEQALVLALEPAPGDRRLVGYVVPRPGAAPLDPAALREFCHEELPQYMVPAAVVELEAFPLDPNGKVKRAALPAPRWADTSAERVAPRTPTEQAVAEIWAGLLHVDEVGVFDDFFTLGGHSLLAMKVVVALRRRFDVDLGVRAVFQHRDVARLAAEVDAAGRSALEAIAHSDALEAPLAPAQSGLWFADRLNPGSREYQITRAVRIDGPLRPESLAEAFTAVVARQEALRSRVVERDGLPVQVVDPATPFDLPVLDLAGSPVEDFLNAQSGMALDLAEGPTFRAVLGRVSETEHILLLVAHHVFVDGWSMKLLADELAEAYGAALAGTASARPAPPYRFAEVAAWQAGRAAEGVEYWRDRLAGMPHVVELPADRPRPAQRDLSGALSSFTVPAATGSALAALSREHGTTRFMTLLAAFEVLVHRATGLTDFAVGTPVAGRDRAETEALIGHFVNTLILRADLAGAPAFTGLLGRVREGALAAFEHQRVPFDRIVEELSPQRELSRNPLVQLVFGVEGGDGEDWRLPGAEVSTLPVHSRTAKFDLYLALHEHEDGSLTGVIEYPTALFDAETIERFGGLYATLLDSIARQPELPIDRLALIDAAERERLLHGVNPSATAFSEDACLHELIEAQAARTPDEIAVEYGGDLLSYRRLDEWASLLAARLRALGVGPDVPVGVRMDRSAELIVGLLAVLKAGGAYLPIETEAPDARALSILGDAGARVCLVNAGAAVPDSADVVFVPVDAASGQGTVPAGSLSEVGPENLISLYYTSGSTGRPKGVASTHRGWVNRMEWMQNAYRLQPGEAVLQKTTMVFDDSAVECFWPLLVGARVVLIDPGLHRDPGAIRDAAIRHRVAVLQFVPSMLALFLEGLDERAQAGLASLRAVITSGEALQPDLLRLFFEKLGGNGTTLHNQWGATEVSIDSTMRTCLPEDVGGAGSVSLGGPIENNTVHVLDAHFEPVPVGLPGDLYLGGVGLARGYHADPAKTAGAFVPDPFGQDPAGARLYRTGDRGYRRPDGTVVFLGRQDHQVKIRGIRVEPGEVEQVLGELPGVREAAVTVWEAAPGDKRLAGYLVPAAGIELTAAAVREQLRDRLPGYLVPGSLTVLDAMPTTASGKIDRLALPAPGEADQAGADYVEPDGPVAEAIAEIWAEVLDVPRVGALDAFFDLGGHSLLAIRAMARLRAEFDLELPLGLLFQRPVLQDLSTAVEQILLAEPLIDGTDPRS